MTHRAILIGINYYNSDCQLAGCLDDIDDVMQCLLAHGWSRENIITLRDSPADPTHGAVDAPTRRNILVAFYRVYAQLQPNDLLYIHYSGHGSSRPDQPATRDERDGIDECICPVDCDTEPMIYDDELNDILVKPLPEHVRLRVIFDSCHSGSCLDLAHRWGAADENTQQLDKDIIFISGCRDDQTSADAVFDGRANGALTWAWLATLAALRPRDTYAHLCERMRKLISSKKYTQVPQLDAAHVRGFDTRFDLFPAK